MAHERTKCKEYWQFERAYGISWSPVFLGQAEVYYEELVAVPTDAHSI